MSRLYLLVVAGLLCLGMVWPAAAAPKTVAVGALEARPAAYRGTVAVVGVVASVTRRRGFVLISSREFKACGLACLAEPDTARVPVLWSGPAPKVAQEVVVHGVLSRTSGGWRLQADRLSRR